MSHRISWKLAWRNFKAHRRLNLPYVFAIALMLALEFVMVSLIENHYVQTRHQVLPTIMKLGCLIGGILSVIFILYAENFSQKQRKAEMGLYTILGLENKHIHRMLAKERLIKTALVVPIAVLEGYLIGSLMFLLLNRMMNETGVPLMEYPFSLIAAGVVVSLYLGLQVLLRLQTLWQLHHLKPVDWLQASRRGEKEPNGNLMLGILGLGLLILGYVKANQSGNLFNSIPIFFLATLLVIAGTYLIFTSLSIWGLKALKRRPNFYYKKAHFLSLSGMLYRMKANAVSLASIAILSTGVILTLGLTLSLYRNMNQTGDQVLEREYLLEEANLDIPSEAAKELLDQGIQQVTERVMISNGFFHQSLQTIAYLQDGVLHEVPLNAQGKSDVQDFYLLVEDLASYQARTNEHVELAANEILLASNRPDLELPQEIELANQHYKVKAPAKKMASWNMAVDSLAIVVPEGSDLKQVQASYRMADLGADHLSENPINYRYYFDAQGDLQVLNLVSGGLLQKGLVLSSRQQMKRDLYSVNGGLLYLGVLVSVILMMGIGLLLYYKQLSEGLSDQINYNIMKRVGLDEGMIKQTIRSQILWIFILPLIAAMVHTLAAWRLVFGTLQTILLVNDQVLIISSILIIVLAFILVYLVFYLMSSGVYYRLVNQNNSPNNK